MEIFKEVLTFINLNYPTILICVLLIIGITYKTIKFFNQSAEAQKEQIREEVSNIKEYIMNTVYTLIVKAEQQYGGGTGFIKKSAVFKDLIDLFPCIEDYITDGDIGTDEIGDIIDEAVSLINEKLGTNKELSKIFTKTGTRSTTKNS